MSIAVYLDVVRLSIRRKLEYRFNTIIGLVSRLIFFTALYALWKVVYQFQAQVAGYSFGQMISYTLLAVLVASVVETNTGKEAQKQVNRGEINNFIIKPLNFMAYHIAYSLGVFVFEFVIAAVILAALILFFPGISYVLSPARLIAFPFALVAANIIYTQLYLTVGILAFWIREGSFLVQFVKKFVKFLAGGYIPIGLFPLLLQQIVLYLPFAATIYLPVRILVQPDLSTAGLAQTLALQFLWLVALFGLNTFLWRRGIRKYESVGI
jgi:ABC-2 type transport system permease protein